MDEVSPDHLREGVAFQIKLRGYDMLQVDDFLDRVAGGIELMQQQLRDALERAARAEQQAAESAETDQALHKTLVLAQRTAEQATRDAEEQAASIVAGAEATAKRLKLEGQRELRSEIKQLEKARAALEADIDALDRYLNEERARLKQLFADQLEQLDRGMGERAPAPSSTDVTVPPEVELEDDAAPEPAVVDEPEGDDEHAPVDVPVDVFADAAVDDEATGSDHADEPEAVADPFMDELRKAVDEEEPLGPRDHAPATGDQPQLDLPDRSRWGLRRRR